MPYPTGAKRIRFVPKTYTFHPRNVYVFTAKRIRFTRDTYTLRPSRVYVAGKRPCHLSPRDAVKMETRLERAGGSRWSLKHSELGVPEVVECPQ